MQGLVDGFQGQKGAFYSGQSQFEAQQSFDILFLNSQNFPGGFSLNKFRQHGGLSYGNGAACSGEADCPDFAFLRKIKINGN